MKPEIQPGKIVVLSGAGISAASGLPTFRDSGGLWMNYAWEEVASPEGWHANPGLMLEFFNTLRDQVWQAKPNAAHHALATLESRYDVVIITQNIDELHERARSTNVIHLHGNLAYARSEKDTALRRRIDGTPIRIGQSAEDGAQLRPDVVLFGEEVPFMDTCRRHVAEAAKILVVGTSLSVFPAASLVKAARGRSEKVLVAMNIDHRPYGFNLHRGCATAVVPAIVKRWLTAPTGIGATPCNTMHKNVPNLVSQ